MNLIIFFSPSSLCFPFAIQAIPFSVWSKISIFFRKFVAFIAVCFSSVSRRRIITAQDIFSCSYRFKMIWINALSIFTQVVDLKGFRNRALKKFIRYSMGTFGSLSGNMNLPIAFNQTTGPFPAIVLFNNFIEQTILKGLHLVFSPYKGDLVK